MKSKKTISISVVLKNNTDENLSNVPLLNMNRTMFKFYYVDNEISREIEGIDGLLEIYNNKSSDLKLMLSDLSIYSPQMSQTYQRIFLICAPSYNQENYTLFTPVLDPNSDDASKYSFNFLFNLGELLSDIIVEHLIPNSSVKISFNVHLVDLKENEGLKYI